MRLKHRVLSSGPEFQSVSSLFETIKSCYEFQLRGSLWLLDTDELFIHCLPTGDVFLSTGYIKGLTSSEVAWVLAHEIGHMHMRHQQEHLGYSHIATMVVAWMHRENHHTTERIGGYLVKEGRWRDVQEMEANAYAEELMKKAGVAVGEKPVCLRGMHNYA